jgi:hypothetical protein
LLLASIPASTATPPFWQPAKEITLRTVANTELFPATVAVEAPPPPPPQATASAVLITIISTLRRDMPIVLKVAIPACSIISIFLSLYVAICCIELTTCSVSIKGGSCNGRTLTWAAVL